MTELQRNPSRSPDDFRTRACMRYLVLFFATCTFSSRCPTHKARFGVRIKAAIRCGAHPLGLPLDEESLIPEWTRELLNMLIRARRLALDIAVVLLVIDVLGAYYHKSNRNLYIL